jgi:hypothetical protein
LETLVASCEFLVGSGHNSSEFNPYSYSIKKLFKLVEVQRDIRRSELAGELYAQHLSRIACVSGDAKPFNELMTKIAGEE